MDTTPDCDRVIAEAVAMMHAINRRLLAGRLTSLRVTWAGGTRAGCAVLDRGACVALAPGDPPHDSSPLRRR